MKKRNNRAIEKINTMIEEETERWQGKGEDKRRNEGN
jgi:hypothetical protein